MSLFLCAHKGEIGKGNAKGEDFGSLEIEVLFTSLLFLQYFGQNITVKNVCVCVCVCVCV